MLHILGSALAKELRRDELICCGLLRLSVMEYLDPAGGNDLARMSLALKCLSYTDWMVILSAQPLFIRLMSLGVEQPDTIIGRLKQTLTVKQSLLTIAAR